MKMNKQITTVMFLVLTLFWLNTDNTHAQTTAFTYQGSLKNGSTPATGNYDFEVVLFDQLGAGGVQLIPTIFVNNVPVTDGIFSVKLDFGNLFPGANRFLEIRVRQTGGGAFTLLTPRQQVNSTPYSIKSLNAENAATATNATQLGGVSANQFVQTTDTRLSDERNPLPNSGNYIQNTTTQQTSSNFNISGTGNAGIFNAATAYNIGGSRVLSTAGVDNLFAGVGAGQANTGFSNSFFGANAGRFTAGGGGNSFFGRYVGYQNTTGFSNSFFGSIAGYSNTTGSNNAFFGIATGLSNTTGNDNSFFGADAGRVNTTGDGNAFFGRNAGHANTTGFGNAFFGRDVGYQNTTGNNNAFFGRSAGYDNTTGFSNAFFGLDAGRYNTTGSHNTFFGEGAGQANTTGSNNTIVGFLANVGSNNLTNVTAIGANAVATVSNSVVLGNNASVAVGMNTFPNNFGGRLLSVASSSLDNGGLTVGGNGDNEVLYLYANTTSNYAGIQVKRPNVMVDNLVLQEQGGNVGIGTNAPLDRLQVEGIIRVSTLGAAGATTLCRNASNQISTCSSSVRYKTNINSFRSGLSLVKRLRPVSFNWHADNQLDFGLVAEEVAEVEPLLVTRNEKGEVEGVKYDRLGVVLLNAVKEQQTQIEQQKTQIEQQQQQIDVLKKLVCASNPNAEICKENQDEK